MAARRIPQNRARFVSGRRMSHAAHMSAEAPPNPSLAATLRGLGPRDDLSVQGEEAFLILLDAPTGRPFGLCWVTEGDAPPRWAYRDGASVVPCDAEAVAGGERRFVELLEVPRREVEDALDAAASRHGLEVGALLRSLPSVPWIRAVLASRHDHLCRLALGWLLPSELREARDAIVAVAEDDKLQIAVRQLAERLVVAEDLP